MICLYDIKIIKTKERGRKRKKREINKLKQKHVREDIFLFLTLYTIHPTL